MTIDNFNNLYGDKGGIEKLTEMRESLQTLDTIANHFGVSRERIRQWIVEIFGTPYDPRKKRREKRIESMRELVKLHGIEKTKQLYGQLNKYYLKEAIKNL